MCKQCGTHDHTGALTVVAGAVVDCSQDAELQALLAEGGDVDFYIAQGRELVLAGNLSAAELLAAGGMAAVGPLQRASLMAFTATVYELRGAWPEALAERLRELAVRDFLEAGASPAVIACLCSAASMHMAVGQYDEALAKLKRAEANAPQQPHCLARVYYGLAMHAQNTGKSALAGERAALAYDYHKACASLSSDFRLERDICLLRAIASHQADDLQGCSEWILRAADLVGENVGEAHALFLPVLKLMTAITYNNGHTEIAREHAEQLISVADDYPQYDQSARRFATAFLAMV